MGTFVSHQEWASDVIKKKLDNKKIVFTNGCFDLLHVGHVRYLQEAKNLGDILVVGLNSDASVKALKGDLRPIQQEQDRGEILSALECVDWVILFDELTPLKLISQVKPDILVKGGDWSIENIVGAKEVIQWGGEVKVLQFVPGHSTSGLINKILTL